MKRVTARAVVMELRPSVMSEIVDGSIINSNSTFEGQ